MSKTGEHSLEDVMTYELSTFPAALFEAKDIFRKADKPQLAQAVAELSSKESSITILDFIPPTEQIAELLTIFRKGPKTHLFHLDTA
ncbi:unnamed protein product [Boreogadus saida]